MEFHFFIIQLYHIFNYIKFHAYITYIIKLLVLYIETNPRFKNWLSTLTKTHIMEILILILFVRELFTRRNFKLHIVSRRKTSFSLLFTRMTDCSSLSDAFNVVDQFQRIIWTVNMVANNFTEKDFSLLLKMLVNV